MFDICPPAYFVGPLTVFLLVLGLLPRLRVHAPRAMKAIQRLTLVFVRSLLTLYAFCGLVTSVRDSPGGGYIFIYILCTLEHVGAKSEVWCTINRFKLPSGLVPLTVPRRHPFVFFCCPSCYVSVSICVLSFLLCSMYVPPFFLGCVLCFSVLSAVAVLGLWLEGGCVF